MLSMPHHRRPVVHCIERKKDPSKYNRKHRTSAHLQPHAAPVCVVCFGNTRQGETQTIHYRVSRRRRSNPPITHADGKCDGFSICGFMFGTAHNAGEFRMFHHQTLPTTHRYYIYK